MILYEEDWAKQGAMVHTTTRNQSFIRMAIILNSTIQYRISGARENVLAATRMLNQINEVK